MAEWEEIVDAGADPPTRWRVRALPPAAPLPPLRLLFPPSPSVVRLRVVVNNCGGHYLSPTRRTHRVLVVRWSVGRRPTIPPPSSPTRTPRAMRSWTGRHGRADQPGRG